MSSQSITEELIAELAAFDFQKFKEQADYSIKQSTIEYRMAKYAALNVDFVETVNELHLYTNAIYDAIVWGKKTASKV